MTSKINQIVFSLSILILLFSIGILTQDVLLLANAQQEEGKDDTSFNTASNVTQFIVNIREISSTTEKNLIALLSSENDVQVKRVDTTEAEVQPGQEDVYSPSKMIDVPIIMNNPVEPGSEIYACVIQLGSDSYSQSIECNIAYVSPTASGEPQRIIVPL